MERLLVLELAVRDCRAEAWLNGVPLAAARPGCPRVHLPVHEFTLAGANRIDLVIEPRPAEADAAPPEMRLGDGQRGAHLHLLLPRIGRAVDVAAARTLAQLDWAPAEGQAHELPATLSAEVALPVNFRRWRWLDAPVAASTGPEAAALRLQVFAFVQRLALDLARGQTDSFIAATRLRTEEIALAYQREPEAETARLRAHLQALYASRRLRWAPLQADGFRLRRVAGGRLLECLDAAGAPALRTLPDEDGASLAFALRVAVVEGNIYVLR